MSETPFIKIYPDINAAYLRPTGAFTVENALEWGHILRAAPGYQPAMNQLIDLRHLDFAAPDTAELTRIGANIMARNFPEKFTVVYIADTDFTFGLTRMFVSLHNSESRPRWVVRTLEDAIAYLIKQRDESKNRSGTTNNDVTGKVATPLTLTSHQRFAGDCASREFRPTDDSL